MTGVRTQWSVRDSLLAAWGLACAEFARAGAARAAALALEAPLRAAEEDPAPAALVPLLEASLHGQTRALAAERHALRAAQATVGRIAGRDTGASPRTAAWLTRAVESLRDLVGTREALAVLTRRLATLAPALDPERRAALLSERRRFRDAAEGYRRDFATAAERAWREEGSAPPAAAHPEDDVVAVLEPVDGWHTWLDEIVDGGPPGPAAASPELSPKSGPIGPLP